MKFAKRAEETYATSNTATSYNPSNVATEPNYSTPAYDNSSSSGMNWGKVALWLGILIVVAALAYFGIRYMNEHKSTQDLPLIVNTDTTLPAEMPATQDTLSTSPEASTSTVSVNNGVMSFEVILNTYDAMDKAVRRTEKLKSYGNNVTMKAAADSSAFYVVLPVTDVAVADTTRVLDSLRRNFNPNGVSILR